jgi:hypothetical protein
MTPNGRSTRRFLLASALLAASATVAAAQAPAPPPPPPPGWAGHGDHHRGPQDWQAEHAKMMEQRLAELHTKLNLKPTQEPAWQAFVTGLQAARPAQKPHEKPDWQAMKMETAPERLDNMLARIDEMRGHLAQLDQVVKTFYAGLSKDQQTIFDDNFKFMGAHPGWRGGGDHHGMGHGGREHGPMGRPPMGPPPGPGMMGAPPPQN